MIVSQVGITPKRAQAFDFSQPYTYSVAAADRAPQRQREATRP
jgi:hypothetical protein